MSNKESFNLQIPFFKKYYRVIAPDFTGFGSSKKLPYAYSLDDYVNEIILLLDSVGATSVDVIAHSFGARVTIKLAIKDKTLFSIVHRKI